jgi:CDP-diacylglycerol--serine O-phosphatidyltransferase
VIRLARFNVLTTHDSGAPKKPGKYILGLPIPGAAGIVVSLVVANHSVAGHLPQLSMLVLAIVLVLSACMVSTIRFRSFKDLKLSLSTVVFVLLGVSSTAFIALWLKPAFALVWLLTSYVVIGLAEAFLSLSARTLRRTRREVQRSQPAPAPFGSRSDSRTSTGPHERRHPR